MSALKLPEVDLSLAMTADAGSSQRLQIVRPWREAICEHSVQYRTEGGSLVAVLDGVRVPLDRPMRLAGVTIDKPWGSEFWYSGIEARGESSVVVGNVSLPLFTYLSLAPQRLCGRQLPVLLKMLKSRPEAVLGELYFEIHQNKQEVYVVADVDRAAHPDGIGSVRFGVNQSLRDQYGDDAEFRRAFLDAVNAYERLAEQQDDKPSNASEKISPDRDLQTARRHAQSFTASQRLRRGDTLTVPAGVPHSLQPGLTVLEFQTPSYERQIIFASQPVQTQSGWDSASAIASMSLDTPEGPKSADDPNELIARFPEFSVSRWRVERGQTRSFEGDRRYAIATVFEGEVTLGCNRGELPLARNQAAFIPASAEAVSIASENPATLLIALANQ